MRRILALAVGGWLLLGGCSAETRQQVLPMFFDGVPAGGEQKPPPPTRRVRRDLLQEIEDLKRQLQEAQEAAKAREKGPTIAEPQRPAEGAKTWQEAAEILPKDAGGNVDWVKALKEGVIAPHPGLDSKAPEQAVLDLDVEMATSGSKESSVTFSHGSHTPWLSCGNCHPTIFPLKRQVEPTKVTMEEIQAGRFCGVCHGRVAFGIDDGCPRCHPAMGGG